MWQKTIRLIPNTRSGKIVLYYPVVLEIVCSLCPMENDYSTTDQRTFDYWKIAPKKTPTLCGNTVWDTTHCFFSWQHDTIFHHSPPPPLPLVYSVDHNPRAWRWWVNSSKLFPPRFPASQHIPALPKRESRPSPSLKNHDNYLRPRKKTTYSRLSFKMCGMTWYI